MDHALFEDLQMRSFGLAAQRLAGRSCHQNARITVTTQLRAVNEDLSPTPKQQRLLADVLSGFELRHAPASFGVKTFVSTGLPLPTTHEAFLSTLLSPTNQVRCPASFHVCLLWTQATATPASPHLPFFCATWIWCVRALTNPTIPSLNAL